MAGAAAKKQAAYNKQVLSRLHMTSLGVNGFFFIARFIIEYRWVTGAVCFKYFVLLVVSLVLEFQLESMGRPRYDMQGTLLRPGDDLKQPGVTEYFFDIIYVTWAVFVLAIFTEWAWWLYFTVISCVFVLALSCKIPGYAMYKVYTIYSSIQKRRGESAERAEVPTSNRQAKLQNRAAKGDSRVKYAMK